MKKTIRYQATTRNKERISNHESFYVLQLYLSFAAPSGTTDNPGNILRRTVGVMAVVALQLVGFMLQSSIATNAREANGGDITVIAQGAPLKSSDLTFFNKLKADGAITNYTAIVGPSASLNNEGSSAQFFTLDAVDPHNFPVVSQPTFVAPDNGSIGQFLTNNR